MKLVMTLLVRNEADIIEANLDYHLAQGVDFVIVTDHASSDETVELLRPYEQAGVVEVLREKAEGYHQSVCVTHMARLALSRHAADWVINNDADEFWWPLSGSLRDVFASIPAGYGLIEVQRRNFLPQPDSTVPFHSRLLYREAQSLNAIGGPLEGKVAHRAHPDVVAVPGNHSISGVELSPAPAGELLEIFHFPMRSYEQFERKVIQTGIGYEKLDHRSPGVGRDQLMQLEIYREGGLRQYYDDALLDDAALRDGVAQGSIVLDRRLRDFMGVPPDPVPQPDRPDGPPTRSFLASALGAFLELDSEREASARARSETAALEQQLTALEQQLKDREREASARARSQAALEQQLKDSERETSARARSQAALEQQLAACQAELAVTDAALQSLRASRLLRWSGPLRRVWYRVPLRRPRSR